MRQSYLVDTNILIWGWHEPHRIPQRYRDLLAIDAEFYVSLISIWEINIKVAIGKLATVDHVSDAVRQTGYRILPVTEEHVEAVRHLPLHHRDPYDRLLIAQAQLEGLTIVTADRHFSSYEVALA